MVKIWLVTDSPSISLANVQVGLEEFIARTEVALEVQIAGADELEHIEVSNGDVVVVAQAESPSTLPDIAPPWLNALSEVLPVVKTLDDAKKLRPYLAERNALVRAYYEGSFDAVLLDTILSRALLRRQQRSIFISYQRSLTVGVARQLASALQAQGFHVFLDERSMEGGTDFNEEIGYALNDADLVVLLATATTTASPWVLKEVTFSNNSKIGVVAIDCDGSGLDSDLRAILDEPQLLTFGRSVRGTVATLTEPEIQLALAHLRGVRVASIVRRIENLLPAAIDMLKTRYVGSVVDAGAQLGQLVVRGRPGLTQVLPFRPTAEVLFELRCQTQEPLVVIHPENEPLDPRVLALQWLCLPVEQQVELQDVQRLWI